MRKKTNSLRAPFNIKEMRNNGFLFKSNVNSIECMYVSIIYILFTLLKLANQIQSILLDSNFQQPLK